MRSGTHLLKVKKKKKVNDAHWSMKKIYFLSSWLQFNKVIRLQYQRPPLPSTTLHFSYAHLWFDSKLHARNEDFTFTRPQSFYVLFFYLLQVCVIILQCHSPSIIRGHTNVAKKQSHYSAMFGWFYYFTVYLNVTSTLKPLSIAYKDE